MLKAIYGKSVIFAADMVTRLLYCLALLAYINTIFHQDGHVHGNHTGMVIDGASLVEIILEDALDIPYHHGEEDPDTDFQYDEYRPSTANHSSILPPTKHVGIVLPPIIDLYKQLIHVDFDTKISCLLGYYTFLFRLKPF